MSKRHLCERSFDLAQDMLLRSNLLRKHEIASSRTETRDSQRRFLPFRQPHVYYGILTEVVCFSDVSVSCL